MVAIKNVVEEPSSESLSETEGKKHRFIHLLPHLSFLDIDPLSNNITGDQILKLQDKLDQDLFLTTDTNPWVLFFFFSFLFNCDTEKCV